MNEEQRQQIEELCEPLKDEIGPYLKAIVIYGSAARKERVEGSDIDILVLVDDTRPEFDKTVYSRAKNLVKQVEDEAPDELDLHFQPPKPLSSWWDLLISGEPWAVTSMKDAQPVYDSSDYVTLTQRLLEDGEMHGTQERAQRLMKRSREKVQKTRRFLMEDVTAELLSAMTESAQAVLMYYGRPPPSPNHVAEELEKNFVDGEELLSIRAVEDYRAFYELTERIDHGQLTDFTAAEMDKYLHQSMAFIKAMATLFDKLETQKHEDIVSSAHEEALALCKEALEEQGVDLPTDDDELLEQFKTVFVEEGMISGEYWNLLQQIVANKSALEQGDLENMSEKEIYSSRAHLRDFASALQDSLSREEPPQILETSEDEETNVDMVKTYCDQVLDEYEDVVKAIWLLSIEDIKKTNDMTVVILYNDLVAGDVSMRELKAGVRSITDAFEQEKDIDLHPTFYALSDYWNLVRHGSPVTFSEIREGIPVYDPTGFFLPLKKLLSAGKIPGTKEAMRALLMNAPRRAMKVKNRYRARILEQLYNAVVDAGQAALIVEGVSPPVQKKLAQELEIHLVDTGVLQPRDVERCDGVITLWKDYEHSDSKELDGDTLDQAMDDTIKFIETVEELLEQA